MWKIGQIQWFASKVLHRNGQLSSRTKRSFTQYTVSKIATAFKPIWDAAKKSADCSCKSSTFWARSSPASAKIFNFTFLAPARAISVKDKKPAAMMSSTMIMIFLKETHKSPEDHHYYDYVLTQKSAEVIRLIAQRLKINVWKRQLN